MRRGMKSMKFGGLAAASMLLLVACGSSGGTARPTTQQPPTANMKPQTTIGAGEGQLNLILWDGYADKSWVDPFTAGDRLQGQPTPRRIVGRDGQPDEERRRRAVGHGLGFR